VIAGTAAYFVYGEVTYRDAFGKRRVTTFCSFHNGERTLSPRGRLATYYKWNEAT
jgi:hypothetical protein